MLRPLEDVTVTEGGSATFQLELSQEGVTGEWARGGVRLHPGPQCRIHTEGRTYHLALSGLGLADAGCISFTADALRCAARLTVRGAASGTLLPAAQPGCDSADPTACVAPTDHGPVCPSLTSDLSARVWLPRPCGPVWPQRLPCLSVAPLALQSLQTTGWAAVSVLCQSGPYCLPVLAMAPLTTLSVTPLTTPACCAPVCLPEGALLTTQIPVTLCLCPPCLLLAQCIPPLTTPVGLPIDTLNTLYPPLSSVSCSSHTMPVCG